MKPTEKRSQFVQILVLWATVILHAAAAQPGQPAPDLVLPLLSNGSDVDLTDFEGKVVYVDFWASWCGPCRQSLPLYEALRKRLPSDRFQILAVNLDEDTGDAQKFLERHPVSYPVLVDTAGNAARNWAVPVMPSSYLVNIDGNLAKTYFGFEPSHMEQIEHDIKTLLQRVPGTHGAGTDGLR